MMQCFICFSYMMVLCSANPTRIPAVNTNHEQRSLFRDVIESLRIRSHLPEDINPNDGNNLSQNYDRYGFEDEPSHLLDDSGYIPRRNDRIEMPPLKYRFPKNINMESDEKIESKEVMVYINSNLSKQLTQRPKNDKLLKRTTANKVKLPNGNKENEANITEPNLDDGFPFSNIMHGQSQIGNRESQTVLKPTVIVNLRGSVTHRDSDIKLEGREGEKMEIERGVPFQNVFNIKQEVKIGKDVDNRKSSSNNRPTPTKNLSKVEDNIMICETSAWKSDMAENRKNNDAFEILFST